VDEVTKSEANGRHADPHVSAPSSVSSGECSNFYRSTGRTVRHADPLQGYRCETFDRRAITDVEM
jgi:hypothetical protein